MMINMACYDYVLEQHHISYHTFLTAQNMIRMYGLFFYPKRERVLTLFTTAYLSMFKNRGINRVKVQKSESWARIGDDAVK